MKDSTSFFQAFAGSMPMVYFLAYIIWAYIGMGINLFVELTKRKPQSPGSPVKLHGGYYWADNRNRILISALLIPVAILMSKELMGLDITRGVAISIGFGADTLAEIVKRKAFSSPELAQFLPQTAEQAPAAPVAPTVQ
jgi:hypothetical protein